MFVMCISYSPKRPPNKNFNETIYSEFLLRFFDMTFKSWVSWTFTHFKSQSSILHIYSRSGPVSQQNITFKQKHLAAIWANSRKSFNLHPSKLTYQWKETGYSIYKTLYIS